MKIYKYEVQAQPGSYPMRFPVNSRIISAALKSGMIAVWAEVDPSVSVFAVKMIHVLPAGYEEVPPFARFVATILQQDLVWHVYEQVPIEQRKHVEGLYTT